MPPKKKPNKKEEAAINSERRAIENYLSTHQLESSINEVLNSTLHIKPDDPFIYLSEKLKDKSPAPRGILSIRGYEVFDSRGFPIVEVEITTDTGIYKAQAPPTVGKYTTIQKASDLRGEMKKESGLDANVGVSKETGGSSEQGEVEGANTASPTDPISDSKTNVNANEGESNINTDLPMYPKELRDGDMGVFNGLGVSGVVSLINDLISPELIGKDPSDQKIMDDILLKLDDSVDRTKLGVNIILATSLAVCKAGAGAKKVPLYRHIADLSDSGDQLCLPVPVFNVISGGIDANNALPFKEICIIPTGADSVQEGILMVSKIVAKVKELIVEKFGSENLKLCDKVDGTLSPTGIESIDEYFTVLSEAIEALELNDMVKFMIDIDGSRFYSPPIALPGGAEADNEPMGQYNIGWKLEEKDETKIMNFEGLSQIYRDLLEKFPEIVSLEDPFHFEHWEAFASLTEEVGLKIQILGDHHTGSSSLTVTEAVEAKSVNGVIIRMNEAGTVSDMIKIVQTARSEGWGIVISSCILEVDDSFLSDFSVGVKAGLFKGGALKGGSERMSKFNQLIRIESTLGDSGYYAGDRWRNTG